MKLNIIRENKFLRRSILHDSKKISLHLPNEYKFPWWRYPRKNSSYIKSGEP